MENGKQAIEKGQTIHFDYVITDLFMPELDGWGVLSFYSQKNPPSRVIVLTAHGEEDAKKKAWEKGAWAYIEKPFVIDKITGMLNFIPPL